MVGEDLLDKIGSQLGHSSRKVEEVERKPCCWRSAKARRR